MTRKKERQKLARKIRKICKGLLRYSEAHSLAGCLNNCLGFTDYNEWFVKRGFKCELITVCDCCGPKYFEAKGRGSVLMFEFFRPTYTEEWVCRPEDQ